MQLVDYLDPDGKGFVTKEYVQNLSVDQMKEVLLFIDPTDVSNTEELEYSHIDAGYIEWVVFEKDLLVIECSNNKTNHEGR